tara:strand:+ start:32954 stop:34453 length:1500 start_codon:yes stop_codon:yes gene_type:complete
MTADVCLLLEGTYPFVPGGVSSWVHQIIRGLPDMTFALVHISPRVGWYDKPVYELPDNVVEMVETHLMGDFGNRDRQPPKRMLEAFCRLAAEMGEGEYAALEEFACNLGPLYRDASLRYGLMHHPRAWQALQHGYKQTSAHASFVDYYWNWVSMHDPMLQVLATELPDAHCYHTISTGYAGLLAAAAGHRTGRPVLLTEHGIYTKERRIEIHSAEWIADPEQEDVLPATEAPVFRQMWNRQFDTYSRACYSRADRIVTLYEGNRMEQIQGGADPERASVIPNGIPVAMFAETAKRHALRSHSEPFTVGFVGRVAPIKDLRTFLSAMRLVADEVDGLVVRILGPTEEDTEYVTECQSYVQQIGLGDAVRFEGRVDLRKELHNMDVLVLTSISEAQPLVVLEAGAVGIPVVCTDVGSCREMLTGVSDADRALGLGGLITPIASPEATAQAVLEMWRQPKMRRKMGRSLQQRVHQFFGESTMLDAYRELYRECMVPSLQEAP